jgi:asparagine synthase (glutamine-hydrolysing)
MCGIAGVFGASSEVVLRRMLGTLRHRGPDDEHVLSNERFSLGARRLSILDVDGGRQPLTNEDGTIVAAQNGEIYNFPELRPLLVKAGHVLHTHTDTEVLPHLWEMYGQDLPTRIDGMFAVAVWDDRARVGFLARDRMGKKPLYYWQHGDALYFASELKALLEVPGFERRLNREALHHYLGYKHVPHPLTIFEGVHMLPPGHRLIFRPGDSPRVSAYWRLSFAPLDGPPLSEEDAVEELLSRLRTAVRRRLMSDVPVGFFLSGGIDSSLTVALAAEVAGSRLKTFTLTYAPEATTSGKEGDRRWARWVAERFATDHTEETVTVGHYPDSVKAIVRAFDEPFAGVSSTYFLAQRMAQHVKVAVAGDGADELFGSYLSHRIAAGIEPAFDARHRDDWVWRADLLMFSDEEKAVLYGDATCPTSGPGSTLDHVRAAFGHLTAGDPLNRVLEFEWRGQLADQVLTFVDRLSMAHSLEVRSAFLDTGVVEFVARLPGSLKIRPGVTKYLLKRAASTYFPSEMIHRSKEGFLMPVTQWMRGDLRPWVRDTLHRSRLARHGIFSPARVSALLDELDSPGADYRVGNKVLALLMFQEWYDAYLAPRPTAIPT